MSLNRFPSDVVAQENADRRAQDRRQRVLDDEAFRDRVSDHTPCDEPVRIPFSREDFEAWRKDAA